MVMIMNIEKKKRGKGRLKKRWLDTIENNMGNAGVWYRMWKMKISRFLG